MNNREIAESGAVSRCCGTCYWYNGEIGDGNKFCDELEIDVDEKFFCNKWKEKF